MKHILSLALALSGTVAMWANPNWKIHTTFDEEVSRIVDTPSHTYFISRTQPYRANVAQNKDNLYSLFRYDKDADELMNLSADNLLTENVVQCVEYSPEKRMLVVVYANNNIDLLYDNGDTVNIPAYMQATVAHTKDVNSIFIDAPADRVYLCSEFGYVALNDKKLEVADSRIYGFPVKGMSRTGDTILLLTQDALYSAPISAPRYNLSEYTKVADMPDAAWLVRIGDGVSLVCAGKSGSQNTYVVSEEAGRLTLNESRSGHIYNVEHNNDGVTLADSNHIFQYQPDGHYKAIVRHADDRGMAAASADFSEIWYGKMRKGICSRRYNPDSEEKWSVTRDYMLPDAPAPFRTPNMAWHKEYGLLVANHGYDWNFTNHSVNSPILLSAYRDGRWTQVSPVYTNPEIVASLMNPNGLAVDPDNTDLVYFGSLLHGIERINLRDGSDILHMSRKSDPFRNEPGFVEIVPDQSGQPSPVTGAGNTWTALSMFSAPEFDSYGNMWMAHSDWDDQRPLQIHLYCWEAADRRASVDAASFRPMHRLAVEGLGVKNNQFVTPLVTSRNKDIVLWTNSSHEGDMMLMHTNGTPSDQSDDKVIHMNTYTDQDGSDFDVQYIKQFLEDPITGYVWVAHGGGVFYFNPNDWLDGRLKVTRVKVARNDGTNLADYLLNDVSVNRIAIDGNGRKWFATSGAGVVCTSSDGRTIEEEITSADTPLPDDIVYGLAYIPDTNSMMFSTHMGMAEYFLSAGGSGGEGATEARAYPNPVRPDYFGYVTIDNIPDGSLVKIVDSRGNLVKELGYVSGETKWDVTDLSFRRVGSGVYYILTSGDANSSAATATVGKILVVN